MGDCPNYLYNNNNNTCHEDDLGTLNNDGALAYE